MLYLITLIVAGAALIANAGALTFRSSWRATLLIGGLAATVGLSLALLLGSPGRGAGRSSSTATPLDQIVRDLGSGVFH